MKNRPGRLRTWGFRLAALVAGSALSLAFPRPSIFILGFVGLVPLLLMVRGAPSRVEAALLAWLGGAGFFMAGHHWLLPQTGPLLLVIGAVLGALWAPWGWIGRDLLRMRTPLPAMLFLPAVWVIGEAVRSWEPLGGPWAVLGASQWNNRPILAAAALGGVWLLSFILILTNAALAFALSSGAGRSQRLFAVSLSALIVGGLLVYGASGELSSGSALTVAGIQPDHRHGLAPRFDAHESLTLQLARTQPDLIVWGESSVGFDISTSPHYFGRLTRAVSKTGSPILVNVDSKQRGAGIRKTSLLIDHSGTAGRYDKMRLVPFGEYVPLRQVFGWISRVTDAPDQDRVRGEQLVVLGFADVAFGPLICFESAFPDMTRDLSRLGVDFIVVQSANTTFQESWLPEQHASLAAVRAVESGRAVLHATIAGVSSAFDPQGRRLVWVPTGHRGHYTFDLPLTNVTTPYVRLGDWILWLSAALLLILAVAIGSGRLKTTGSRK